MKGSAFLKKYGLPLLIALGGIGILLSWIAGRGGDAVPEDACADYAAVIESRLEALLAAMDGVGDCRVMVTMETGVEQLYDTAAREATAEIQPTVRGVLVLCRGGGDTAVRERVTRAVTTALGITSKRVCVEILR